jgi:hypothetical protein
MNKEDFRFELANYFIRKLKEKVREVKFSDLEGWAFNEMLKSMPEDDERQFWLYTNAVKDDLIRLGLVSFDGKMIAISMEAMTLSEPISVRDIHNQKKKKELFEEKAKVWKLNISIAGLIFAILGTILNFLSKHNSVGNVIGWLLVGVALGYFLNEFLNKRIWKN